MIRVNDAGFGAVGLSLVRLRETANPANRIFNPARKDDDTGNAAAKEVDGDATYAAPRNNLYVVGKPDMGAFDVTAEFSVAPPAFAGLCRCAACVDGAKVAGSETAVSAGDTAVSIPAPAAAARIDHALCAGVDADGDGDGLLGAGEAHDLYVYTSPGSSQPRYATVVGITKEKYQQHKSVIENRVTLWNTQNVPSLALPYARSFLALYLNNGLPSGIIPSMQPDMTIRVTIDANAENSGFCRMAHAQFGRLI